nr:palindromic element RPE4 domain-containing protein [Rickettsia asembonensis]
MSPRGLLTRSIKTIKNTNILVFLLDPVVKPRDDRGEIDPRNNATRE